MRNEWKRRWYPADPSFLLHVIAADETRAYHYDLLSKQDTIDWKSNGSPGYKRIRRAKSVGSHDYHIFRL